MLHRDVAARNVLIAEGLVLKVADFGSAKDLDEDEYYQKLTSVRNNSLVLKICFEHQCMH